jgi:heme exporter protein C
VIRSRRPAAFCETSAGARLTLLRTHRLSALAALALGLMVSAVALIAYVAPIDADQGFSQKIFYFHVPVALTSYAMFGWGAWKALLHLWKRREAADLESYVAIHQGVIFGAMTLITGSFWA